MKELRPLERLALKSKDIPAKEFATWIEDRLMYVGKELGRISSINFRAKKQRLIAEREVLLAIASNFFKEK
jgi:hypothetical protein